MYVFISVSDPIARSLRCCVQYLDMYICTPPRSKGFLPVLLDHKHEMGSPYFPLLMVQEEEEKAENRLRSPDGRCRSESKRVNVISLWVSRCGDRRPFPFFISPSNVPGMRTSHLETTKRCFITRPLWGACIRHLDLRVDVCTLIYPLKCSGILFVVLKLWIVSTYVYRDSPTCPYGRTDCSASLPSSYYNSLYLKPHALLGTIMRVGCH